MAILIIGAGAIGSHLAAKLVEMGEAPVLYDLSPRLDFLASVLDLDRVKVIVGDVNNMPLLLDTIKNERIDRIIHLAAFLRRGLTERPYEGIKLNILGTATVLEAARMTGVKRVVFASSGAVNMMAPVPQKGRKLDEDFDMKVLSNRPKILYQVSKLTGEYLGLVYNELYGIDFIALRPAGGFGPAPGLPSGSAGVTLWKLVRNPALGKPVTIDDPLFTYAGRINWIYIKDDANALALACFKQGLQRRVYNVCMDEAYEYMEVVDTVRRVFPTVKIEIKATLAEGDFRQHIADSSAAHRELGWEPQYDLEAGIRDWAKWIKNNERLTV